MKIHVIQLLCPSRHCIVAIAYQSAEMSSAVARSKIDRFLDNGHIARHCGICGSTDLRYEDRPTIFKTLEEAEPILAQLQADNFKTRALLDAAGLTHDVQSAKQSPQN
jgi:hypothetical protein